MLVWRQQVLRGRGGLECFFRPAGAGSFIFPTHGLRRGLYSCAATRLRHSENFTNIEQA